MSLRFSTQQRLERNAPQIRPAGLAGDYTQPNVADLTSSYNPEGCVTPDKIKVYRHRGQDVGIGSRHYGIAHDVPADPNERYGTKSDLSESIDVCLRPGVHVDRMSALVEEQKEKNSRKAAANPLGHPPASRNAVVVPLHGFGMPNPKGETTKSTMSSWRDVDVRHEVGAQTNRNYDWEAVGVDPTQHRFGVASNTCESVADAMCRTTETQLMPKIVRDYKSTIDYEVGKSRTYGFDDPAEWGDDKKKTTTVKKDLYGDSAGSPPPTVKDLLSSWVEPECHNPRCLQAQKTAASAELETSARWASLTNHISDGTKSANQYGRTIVTLRQLEDAATVQQLVQPCHYVTLGVESKYFAGGRDLEGIRALCHKCEFGLSDAQIDSLFGEIAVNGKCGIEQFKNAATAKGLM